MPSSPERARPGLAEPPLTVPPSPGAGAVLLVEDDSAQREAYARILGAAGFTVSAAGSGEEALGLLEGRRGQ